MTWYRWISHRPGRRLWFFSVCPNDCLQSEITISHKAASSRIVSHKATILNWLRVVVGLLPSWPQRSDFHWGRPSLFSTRESICFRLRSSRIRPADGPDQLSSLSGQSSSHLTTHRGKPPSTRHTWAKGFLLIKSHLEEMTSTRLLCLSICSSLPDLFCVWKLNSQIKLWWRASSGVLSLLRKTTRTRHLEPYLFFAEHKTPRHPHTCVAALSWAPHKFVRSREWIRRLNYSQDCWNTASGFEAKCQIVSWWNWF